MHAFVIALDRRLTGAVGEHLATANGVSPYSYRTRLGMFVLAAGPLAAAPAEGQICAGLPTEVSQVVSVAVGSRSDKPPMTDLQYVGASYANVVGEHLTVIGFGQVPVGRADRDFRRVAAELPAAFPRTMGAGCPVITAGYSAQRRIHKASPHVSVGYGVGRRWDRSKGDSWFALYAIPGVLVVREQDYADGGLSTRIRFASELGFLISSTAHLYIGGGVRRAFLDGGGTSMEARAGWAF